MSKRTRLRGTPDATGAQRTYLDALLREAHAHAYRGDELRGLASYRSGRALTTYDASHYIDVLKAAKARGWLMPKPETPEETARRREAILARVIARRERSARAASAMLRRFNVDAALALVADRLTWAQSHEALSRLTSLRFALAKVREFKQENI